MVNIPQIGNTTNPTVPISNQLQQSGAKTVNQGSTDPMDWWFGPNSMLSKITGIVTGSTEANRQAKENADRQMDFQREMANTAHQRELEDLRKAGINPIMTGMGGGGSDTPSGSTFQPQPNNMLPVVSSALQLAQSSIPFMDLDNRTKLNEAQVQNLAANSVSALANSAKNQAFSPLYDIIEDSSKWLRGIFKSSHGTPIQGLMNTYKSIFSNLFSTMQTTAKDAKKEYVDPIVKNIIGIFDKKGGK